MSQTLRSTAACLVWAIAASTTSAQPGPHATINVSQALLRVYRAEDANGFHQLLAPSLQAKYSLHALHQILARCRALTFEIDRFSIPSWGQRNFGFFGVYAETAVLEMILEIDDDEKIIHWVITDDVKAKDQQCNVSRP